jgi:predicted MFS family arabinose efflux permease
MYALSVAAFLAFVMTERKARNPIVPLALFRSRSFTMANVLTLLLYAAMSALTYLLPFELIHKLHYTPARAGAAFLPLVASLAILSRFTGALADRIGARPLLIAGPLITAAGLFALSRTETMFLPGILTVGIGMAITVAPLTTTVMTSIGDEHHAGAASGINNTVARAAGMLAIAVFGGDVHAFRTAMFASAVLAVASAMAGAFVSSGRRS